MSETDSSGGVNPTGDTIPVEGTSPTAIPDSTSDAAGGPQIPGTPGLPHFPELEDDGTTANAMLATAVAIGVAAAATASAPVAAGAAAAAAAAAFIVGSGHQDPQMLTSEGEGDRPDEDSDPTDDA
jgi:hypothetical protein